MRKSTVLQSLKKSFFLLFISIYLVQVFSIETFTFSSSYFLYFQSIQPSREFREFTLTASWLYFPFYIVLCIYAVCMTSSTMKRKKKLKDSGRKFEHRMWWVGALSRRSTLFSDIASDFWSYLASFRIENWFTTLWYIHKILLWLR